MTPERAAELIDALALFHSVRLADALTGATALEHDLPLLTTNTKHLGAVEGLQVEAFAPKRLAGEPVPNHLCPDEEPHRVNSGDAVTTGRGAESGEIAVIVVGQRGRTAARDAVRGIIGS